MCRIHHARFLGSFQANRDRTISRYAAAPTALPSALRAAEVQRSTEASASSVDICEMAKIVEQDELRLDLGI
jgi:hypothetical protein